MEFFSKVESVFTVTGRGCVIVPAKPEGLEFPFSLRKNDFIQLRCPTGVINTYVAQIESLNFRPLPRRMAILLPSDIAKSSVPAGTEIWAEPSKSAPPDSLAVL